MQDALLTLASLIQVINFCCQHNNYQTDYFSDLFDGIALFCKLQQS